MAELTINTVSDIAALVLSGDMRRLTPEQKIAYYKSVCDAAGLDFRLRPFQFIVLNGREVLYADKGCAEQLRGRHNINVTIVSRERIEDVYVVTARGTLPSGRSDESTGAVSIAGLRGDALCNALMKAETKAKRRVTLSLVGLGMIDESELETIPANRKGEPGAAPSLRDALSPKALPPTEPTPAPTPENDTGDPTPTGGPTRSQVDVLRELCNAKRAASEPADALIADATESLNAEVVSVTLDEAEEARLFGACVDAAAKHGFSLPLVDRYISKTKETAKGRRKFATDPTGFYQSIREAIADGRMNAQLAKCDPARTT
jgi:hypothetical protein